MYRVRKLGNVALSLPLEHHEPTILLHNTMVTKIVIKKRISSPNQAAAAAVPVVHSADKNNNNSDKKKSSRSHDVISMSSNPFKVIRKTSAIVPRPKPNANFFTEEGAKSYQIYQDSRVAAARLASTRKRKKLSEGEACGAMTMNNNMMLNAVGTGVPPSPRHLPPAIPYDQRQRRLFWWEMTTNQQRSTLPPKNSVKELPPPDPKEMEERHRKARAFAMMSEEETKTSICRRDGCHIFARIGGVCVKHWHGTEEKETHPVHGHGWYTEYLRQAAGSSAPIVHTITPEATSKLSSSI